MPSGYNSFSIVRSEPQGRVAMQGLGVYSLGMAEKTKNKLRVYFPDLYTGLYGLTESDISNLSNGQYEIELISPLGFKSEVFSGWNDPTNGTDNNIDMLVHADRIYNNQPYLDNYSNINGYYTSFGAWRNNPQSNPIKTYGISSSTKIQESRNSYVEIELDADIYSYQFSGGSGDQSDSNIKNFHEPFYIVNLIRRGADFADNNFNTYVESGHLQKVESLIGVSNDQNGSYTLVDERWEDCIPNSYNNGVS